MEWIRGAKIMQKKKQFIIIVLLFVLILNLSI